MKNIGRGTSITVIGLIIGALGVISPIAWDWWNKRTQIVIEKKSNISIVSISQPVQNLELLYNGKKVSELRKVIFLLRNNGRTPIVKDDVVTPLALNFLADEILEAAVTRKNPENFNASTLLVKNTLTLGFDLFNPGDEAEIEVLISGVYSGFTANARIKNISRIDVLDISEEKKSWKSLGFGAYFSGFFGAVFCLIGFALFLEIPKKKVAKSLLELGAHPILLSENSLDAVSRLKKDFPFLQTDRTKPISVFLYTTEFPLTEDGKKTLADLLIGVIDREESFAGGLVALMLGGISFAYVISKLYAL